MRKVLYYMYCRRGCNWWHEYNVCLYVGCAACKYKLVMRKRKANGNFSLLFILGLLWEFRSSMRKYYTPWLYWDVPFAVPLIRELQVNGEDISFINLAIPLMYGPHVYFTTFLSDMPLEYLFIFLVKCVAKRSIYCHKLTLFFANTWTFYASLHNCA